MAVQWTEENAIEEKWNAWTHGIGFLISIPAGVALMSLTARHQDSLFIACLVYSVTLMAMYLFSALSHAFRDPLLRHRFRMWDQGLIYGFIAGTFTPFICAYMSGGLRVLLLAFVWIAAALGFYSKVFAKHRIDNMSSLTHILLGWVPSMFMLAYVPIACFAAMAVGGVLYTIGTRFLHNDARAAYFHPLWHVIVILASACHYTAILLFPVLRLDSSITNG